MTTTREEKLEAARVIAEQNALGVRWNDWTRDCIKGFPIEVFRHGDRDDFEVIARYPGQHERDGQAYLDQHRAQILQNSIEAALSTPTTEPQPAAEHDPECRLVERGQSCDCNVSKPAADTRVVPLHRLQAWLDCLVSSEIKDEIRAIIGTATPAPSDKIAEVARVLDGEYYVDQLKPAAVDAVRIGISRASFLLAAELTYDRALAGKGE